RQGGALRQTRHGADDGVASGLAVFRDGILSGDKSLADSARQAVHGKAARRLAAAVKSGNHLAVRGGDLAARVDAQARARVVDDRRRPCRVERRLLDFAERLWLAEVIVLARLDEGI